MKKVRDTMLAEGGNIGLCYPVSLLNDRIVVAFNQGDFASMMIDGEDVDLTPENFGRALKLLYPEFYREYEMENEERELWTAVCSGPEGECRDCPWFRLCDAMDEDDEASKWPLVNAVENWERWSPESDGCKVSDVYWDDDINDWAAIAEKGGKEYLLTLDSDGDIQVSPEI